MIQAQSFSAGFSGADEPSHFLNGYFISSYLQHHFGTNPMAFATDFYIHYPKISIGQWPPAYYGLLSLRLAVAAVLGAVLVVPWYLLTAKIAADGFNYQAGIGYAMKALAANTVFLADNISWVALALYAGAAEFRARQAAPLRWTIVSTSRSCTWPCPSSPSAT